jgi:hypothetical protein
MRSGTEHRFPGEGLQRQKGGGYERHLASVPVNRADLDRITKAITTECGHLSKLLGYEAPNPA